MEGEKILMAAGVTVAAVVGAFVFWGPAGNARLRQRRGQIAGLYNFGQTCFLNTLLQSLAACPQFIAWLQLHNGANADRRSLITSLLTTLEVVNGTHSSLRADPYSPGAIIRALNALGWVIPQEEHDAHELFHVLLASLEEEALRPHKIGSLSDALPLNNIQGRYHTGGSGAGGIGDHRPSSALLCSDFLNAEYDETTNPTRLVRSEAHTPDSPASVCCEQEVQQQQQPHCIDKLYGGIQAGANRDFGGDLSMRMQERLSRPRIMSMHSQAENEGLNRRSNSCRSLERLYAGPGRVSIWSDQGPTQVPHPFQGAMGCQIICNGCGFKSSVRYDKFDSITLNLPLQCRSGLSLGHLLSEYISTEELSDVKCESCSETVNHTKTVTFAKLPASLCIHISRSVWLSTGQVVKRQDFVHFPESLSMAPYSFIQPHLNSQAGTPWGSTMSLFSSSLPSVGVGINNAELMYGTMMLPKNLYRLLAVVMHSGEAHSGHFVTYRRGSLRNAHRWFYTSDTIVREVSIEEVLQCSAYLLFYDRSPQRQFR